MNDDRMNHNGIVPEDRIATIETLALDLSMEDGLTSPFEENVPPWFATSSSVAQTLVGFIRSVTEEGDHILIFEPTRPDIRRAIIQTGRCYVDGGRLLNGQPDPATLSFVMDQGVKLIICESGELENLPGQVPILVDQRSTPINSETIRSVTPDGRYGLLQLGPRDGFQQGQASWIRGLAGPDQPAREQLDALLGSAFEQRASLRRNVQKRWLVQGTQTASEAGFETLVQAGFLWLGWPGVSSSDLQTCFLDEGVKVFSVEHHPYRHRVRLCPRQTKNPQDVWNALHRTGISLTSRLSQTP